MNATSSLMSITDQGPGFEPQSARKERCNATFSRLAGGLQLGQSKNVDMIVFELLNILYVDLIYSVSCIQANEGLDDLDITKTGIDLPGAATVCAAMRRNSTIQTLRMGDIAPFQTIEVSG